MNGFRFGSRTTCWRLTELERSWRFPRTTNATSSSHSSSSCQSKLLFNRLNLKSRQLAFVVREFQSTHPAPNFHLTGFRHPTLKGRSSIGLNDIISDKMCRENLLEERQRITNCAIGSL